MDPDLFFRGIFLLVMVVTTVLRLYYHFQARTFRDSLRSQHDPWYVLLIRVLAIPWLIALWVYVFYPPWLSWAALPFPEWLRWVGVALAMGGLLFLWRIHVALDKNFSTNLRIRADHTLVTTGPYRWIRHPMYTAILILMISMLLITANWVIGGIGLLAIALVILLRISHEEAMMLERFGDQYRDYQRRSGRLIPPLGFGKLGSVS